MYSLIGTKYGGDGRITFALPDLRGRVPVHAGQGRGLSPRTLGETGGSETAELTTDQIPGHRHDLMALAGPASATNPAGEMLAQPGGDLNTYGQAGGGAFTFSADLDAEAIGDTGAGRSHTNLMPFLCVPFIVAIDGIYPTPA